MNKLDTPLTVMLSALLTLAACGGGGGGGGGDTTPPAAPTGLLAASGVESVVLDWSDNGETDLNGYHVYRAAATGGPYVQLTLLPIVNSDFTDTGLVGSLTYFYVVTALDNTGNESAQSSEASATALTPGPSDLDYGVSALALSRGIAMVPVAPTVTGTVDEYVVSIGSLPPGLVLDGATGEISGVPLAAQASAPVTISAVETGIGSDSVIIDFEVLLPSARALYSVDETNGLLATQLIDPVDGFLKSAGYISGLDSPIALTLTPDLGYLYVVNSGNGTINGYAVDATTAQLTQLSGSPFAMSGGGLLSSAAICTSPGGEFLYVANNLAGNISAFSIAASGALTELTPPTAGFVNAKDIVSLRRPDGDFLYALAKDQVPPLIALSIATDGSLTVVDTEAVGTSPRTLAASPEGDLLYVLNNGDSTASGFEVGTDGLLTPAAGSPYSNFSGLTTFPLDILVTSDGTDRFLYTVDSSGDLTQSSIAASGALSLIGSGTLSAAGTDLRGLAATPAGDQVFALDIALNETRAYSADGTGALTPHPSMPRMFTQGDFTKAVVLPSATTPVWATEALYGALKTTGGVAQLSVDAGNLLTAQAPLTIATPGDAESAVAHPSLDVLYVTNPGDPTSPLISIPIEADLSLDELGQAGTAATGNNANWIDIDPNGDFLYLVGPDMNISSYPIGVTGLLGTQSAAVATGTLPLAIDVDPTGRYAYVPNFDDDTLSQYGIDLDTGAISALSPATVPVGAAPNTGPRSVLVHPSGRHLFVATAGIGSDGDKIFRYLINPTTGQLFPQGSVAAGVDPGQMACTPNGDFLIVTDTDSIDVYPIDAMTGALSASVSSAAIAASPRSVAVSADGTVVYVGTDPAGTIEAYAIDAAGALTGPIDSESIGSRVRDLAIKTTLQ